MTGKYKLYVGPLQEIPDYAEFSYYESAKRRLFLLCDRIPEGRFAPVPDELLGEMTPTERAWLNTSCLELNRRWMETHKEEAEETANAFLDVFEEELEKEAQKAREVKDGRNAEGSGGEAVSE